MPTITEITERAFELEQIIAKDVWPGYKDKLALLGAEPFLFGVKRWKAAEKLILAEFEAQPAVKELRAIQAACPHRLTRKEDGPFNIETCSICGLTQSYMESWSGGIG